MDVKCYNETAERIESCSSKLSHEKTYENNGSFDEVYSKDGNHENQKKSPKTIGERHTFPSKFSNIACILPDGKRWNNL